MSVFLALDLDDRVRGAVARVIATEQQALKASWLKPDRLHLTLVFLGNPTLEQQAALREKVAPLARAHRPFTLSVGGVGTFSTARAASVLWLGVQGALDALGALQRDAVEQLFSAEHSGVNPAERTRAFTPHVTLARAKKSGAFDDVVQRLGALELGAFLATQVTLYESRHDGYRALVSAPLVGGE